MTQANRRSEIDRDSLFLGPIYGGTMPNAPYLKAEISPQ